MKTSIVSAFVRGVVRVADVITGFLPARLYTRMANRQISEVKRILPKVLLVVVFYIFAPVGIFAAIAGGLVFIDQALYPKNEIDSAFLAPDIGTWSLEKRGALLMGSSYAQLERELDSLFGWAPNDLCCLQFLDNRLNRQVGVIHAARELSQVLSQKVSKFGLGAEENHDLKEARQKHFAFDETEWGAYDWLNAESYYEEGIALVKKYETSLSKKDGVARVNVTTADLYDILAVIKDNVLGEPYGRLIQRNRDVEWEKLDDEVYYAQGAAIVARDALVVLSADFKDMMSKGGEENMTAAIDSLNAIVAFNPWWVARGDGASMWADHRSKMARYYSEAIRRVEDVMKSVKL